MWSSSWIFPSLCLFWVPFVFNECSLSFEWTIYIDSVELFISFFVDSFSLIFFLTVSFVGMMVFFYSLSYMASDSFKKKFIISLLMFVISMVLLVFSSNLFWVMVGWDGLGLSSFYLILHFQNWKSLNSAMVTFLTNRIGDGFLLVTLVWTTSLCHWEYSYLPFTGKLLFLLGAFSKSAQIPFSAWLPLAMAAPTPVSSLVHSSTLVTAGIYLLIRFKETFGELSLVVQVLSFLTIFLAAVSSIGEMDLKKIIALSTLSHIGLMILSISMGMYAGAFVHLVLHAFFKSLLFMISGIIIHMNSNCQDIRKIGLLSTSFMVSCPLIVSLMSMVGAPFLSGFVSKEILFSHFMVSGVSVWMFLFSVFFTGAYSFRLLAFLFKNSSVVLQPTYTFLEGLIFYSMSFFSICGSILVKGISSLEDSQLGNTVQPFFYSEAKVLLFLILISGMFFGVTIPLLIPRFKISLFFHEMLFILYFSLLLQKSVLNFSLISMFKVFTKGTMETFILNLASNLGKMAGQNFQLLSTLLVFEEFSLVVFTLSMMI